MAPSRQLLKSASKLDCGKRIALALVLSMGLALAALSLRDSVWLLSLTVRQGASYLLSTGVRSLEQSKVSRLCYCCADCSVIH
jgi:hypothetical protein